MILPQVKIRSPVPRGHTDGLQKLEVSRSPIMHASTSEKPKQFRCLGDCNCKKNTANGVQGLMMDDKYIPCCFIVCQRKNGFWVRR